MNQTRLCKSLLGPSTGLFDSKAFGVGLLGWVSGGGKLEAPGVSLRVRLPRIPRENVAMACLSPEGPGRITQGWGSPKCTKL